MTRIPNDITSERYTAMLACMGIRSSVNDMLAFFLAVMNRHDEEEENKPRQPLQQQSSWNPLNQISTMWGNWWTRPTDDGFETETAYLLGWYRTTIPSSALGLTSYNFHRYSAEDKPFLKYIIGRDSRSHTLYGHNGITYGSVSTAYIFPNTHSGVDVLSNAADAGDAAEATAQILLQALFDLKPHIDLLPSVTDARDRCLKAHDDMIADWQRGRDVSKYNTASPNDYVGSYLGLNVSSVDIVPDESADAKLAVAFGHNSAASKCDLEPYNADTLSFLPLKHDDLLARGMIDWDFYKVGILECGRRGGEVVGLW